MMTQTFNIALPTDLVKRADVVAKREYRNRSELIREALRVYLEDKSEWEELFTVGQNAMQKMGIKREEQVNKLVSQYRHGRKQR